MSAISLRLPDSLHERARQIAREENVSINQLITLALAEKVSALSAEEYLAQRTRRASKRKFQKALSKVAKIKPEPFDRLSRQASVYLPCSLAPIFLTFNLPSDNSPANSLEPTLRTRRTPGS
ncbi:toxin-antitoxin system HicB family antitoxin [Candidatus Sumerlaeota bacterium]|nr:toxin-antitoxin system HicB family antitoxin [Candidatus Sumerlaeota bacterium]MBI3735664.1 toxin-antitoxin system HicB family antitoxin [Candidatus Sumerlaeota bacterium]